MLFLPFKIQAQELFVSIGFMHEVIRNVIRDSKVFLLNLVRCDRKHPDYVD